MQLEQEIHQKNFRNEWQKGVVNILFTHCWLTTQLKEFLKPFDITPQQYNVLRILRGQYPHPITTSVIRERMLDKMSDISRMVERLQQKDLIIRSACAADRRLVDVVISPKGLELLAELDKLNAQMDNVLQNLTTEEAQHLNYLLDKIRD